MLRVGSAVRLPQGPPEETIAFTALKVRASAPLDWPGVHLPSMATASLAPRRSASEAGKMLPKKASVAFRRATVNPREKMCLEE